MKKQRYDVVAAIAWAIGPELVAFSLDLREGVPLAEARLSGAPRDLVSAAVTPVVRFFFSSSSRHTRWPRDWSSDVCSSDLPIVATLGAGLLFFLGRNSGRALGGLDR